MGREFILDRILGERGFSVADLTRMAMLGRSTIDDIRRKGGGRRENLEKIAAALGLEYEDLFLYDGEPLGMERQARKNRIFVGADLLDAAERYGQKDTRSDHKEHINLLTTTVANLLGMDVYKQLDEADAKFEDELYEDALDIYIQAMVSLKRRYAARLLASLPNILSVCMQNGNIHPVNALYRLVKDYNPTEESFEILCRMAAFYLNEGTDDTMIMACLNKAKEHAHALNGN
jgi:transcriptional regulator with XRE-family HTH domain